MANKTNAELAKEVRELRAMVERLTGTAPRTEGELPPEERPDYIAHGSDEHAAFLGLREVKKDADVTPYAEAPNGKYYTLMDKTIFGTAVRSEFLQAFLEQRVNELQAPTVPPEAPPMWRPTEAPTSGITV